MATIPDWLEEILAEPTCDIHEAGRALGLARHRAFAAVAAGAIPVIRVGKRRMKVPTSWLRQVLRLDGEPRVRRTK